MKHTNAKVAWSLLKKGIDHLLGFDFLHDERSGCWPLSDLLLRLYGKKIKCENRVLFRNAIIFGKVYISNNALKVVEAFSACNIG